MDQDNYARYLQRMTNSADTSTKSLLPFFTAGMTDILDVGIGSGVLGKKIRELNPHANIVGIDVNPSNVQNAGKSYNVTRCISFCDYAEKIGRRYDAILFSSVLHEIGSYWPEKEERFTLYPLDATLRQAYNMLKPGGRVIIRDGLAFPADEANQMAIATLAKEKDYEMLDRFMRECPFLTAKDKLSYKRISENGRSFVALNKGLLKEFLATYTWGESSWDREIREKFCYASVREWNYLIKKNGFLVQTEYHSPDGYEQFFAQILKKCVNRSGPDGELVTDDDSWGNPSMTITLVAKKI